MKEGKAEIVISFTDCKDCPYVGKTCKELVCNHSKRRQLKPYAKDRKVNPEGIDNGCPIR